MQEEKKEYPKGIKYKINENGKYTILVKNWNGMTFYNIRLIQKKQDGTEYEFKRQVYFNNCEPPNNGDVIKIISGYESNYANKKDPYNCITTIVINEWELAELAEERTMEAYEEYNNITNDNGGDIVITDDDFGF